MTLLILDDPAALTESVAQEILTKLFALCRAQHARASKRGDLVLRGFCACGHPSIGRAGALCAELNALMDGGDEAQWITRAKALRDALEAASARLSEPATP